MRVVRGHTPSGLLPRVDRSPQATVEQPAQEKDWTVLLYNAGYGDESKMCTYSLTELEKVGSDDNTHLVAMNYRRGWSAERLLGLFGEYEGAKTYYVTRQETREAPLWERALPQDARHLSQTLRSGPHQLRSPVIEEHPDDINMGDPATLKKFLVDNMRKFPAKRYAVVMSGHGAAFAGQMIVHHPEGRMQNDELARVFEEVAQETGKKIDLVNMNTCFSANLESLYPLRNSAEALVASEDTVFAATQPIAETVMDLQRGIHEGLDLDGKDLAKLFVERARRQTMGNLYVPTLSALDTSALEPLAESVKNLQETLMGQKVAPEKIKECLQNSQQFNYSSIPRDVMVTDLGSFARQLEERVNDEQVRVAAGRVLAQMKACILAEQHLNPVKESVTTKMLRLMVGPEPNREGVTGLTIYVDPDVHNDARLHRVEGGSYARRNDPGRFMKYVSQATEEERAQRPEWRNKLEKLGVEKTRWKYKLGQKIPIPFFVPIAEKVGMAAAMMGTFSGLSSLGIPAYEGIFGTYFTGKGLYDVGTGLYGAAKILGAGPMGRAQKEQLIQQLSKAVVGACMGTFGLYIHGVLPRAVAWPAALGALGVRVGKELVTLGVRAEEGRQQAAEAAEYDQLSTRGKLERVRGPDL